MSAPVLILQGPDAAQALREIAAALRPEAPDEVLTLLEAAAFLKISSETLSAMAHRGEVPCRDVGSRGRSRFIFSRNALSRWLGGEE